MNTSEHLKEKKMYMWEKESSISWPFMLALFSAQFWLCHIYVFFLWYLLQALWASPCAVKGFPHQIWRTMLLVTQMCPQSPNSFRLFTNSLHAQQTASQRQALHLALQLHYDLQDRFNLFLKNLIICAFGGEGSIAVVHTRTSEAFYLYVGPKEGTQEAWLV